MHTYQNILSLPSLSRGRAGACDGVGYLKHEYHMTTRIHPVVCPGSKYILYSLTYIKLTGLLQCRSSCVSLKDFAIGSTVVILTVWRRALPIKDRRLTLIKRACKFHVHPPLLRLASMTSSEGSTTCTIAIPELVTRVTVVSTATLGLSESR